MTPAELDTAAAAALCARAREGDRGAWAIISLHYERRALSVARAAVPGFGRLDRAQTAEDRDQTARLAMWCAVRSFDPGRGPLGAWIVKRVEEAFRNTGRAERRQARTRGAYAAALEHRERNRFPLGRGEPLEFSSEERPADMPRVDPQFLAFIDSLHAGSIERDVAVARCAAGPQEPDPHVLAVRVGIDVSRLRDVCKRLDAKWSGWRLDEARARLDETRRPKASVSKLDDARVKPPPAASVPAAVEDEAA